MSTAEVHLSRVLSDGSHFQCNRKAVQYRDALVTRRTLFQQALAACDASMLIVTLAASYELTRTLLRVKLPPLTAFLWLLCVIVPVWLLSLRWFGLFEASAYSSLPSALSQLIRAHLVGALILLSTMYATKAEMVSRVLMQNFLTLSIVALAVQSAIVQALLKRHRSHTGFNCPRVLLIGEPEKSSRYMALLERYSWMSARVVGLLCPRRGIDSRSPDTETRILGEPHQLERVLNDHVIDEVVALPPADRGELENIASCCAERGLVMRVLVEVPSAVPGNWHVDDCGEGSLFVSLAAIPQNAMQLAMKRLIDIIGGIAGLALFAIAAAFYARRLRRETGGSAIFRQQRVGRNGRLFTLYKFRTMHHDAERRHDELQTLNQMKGPIFKLQHDPRVTQTGAKLRQSHVDELPQFLNVLKGEMSLVGTRPPTQTEVVHYKSTHRRRLSMKPGLTGPWQVNGNQAVGDFEDIVRLDTEYIANWSLSRDLRIILQTVKKVIRADAW
jgi:exopolysaccharide biosynthesis polyprenyl glycosylphosphotransferase